MLLLITSILIAGSILGFEDRSYSTLLEIGDILIHSSSRELTRKYKNSTVVAVAPLSPLPADDHLFRCAVRSRSIEVQRAHSKLGRRRKFLSTIGTAKMKRRATSEKIGLSETQSNIAYAADGGMLGSIASSNLSFGTITPNNTNTISTNYYDTIEIEVSWDQVTVRKKGCFRSNLWK